MKKAVLVLIAVCVVCAAGAAFAQPGRQDSRQPQQGRYLPPCCRGYYDEGPRWNYDQRTPQRQTPRQNFRAPFAPDMPPEIRAKAVELAKLRIDLEEVLSAPKVDKEKATAIHAQIQKLEDEIEAWKFEKRLERIEAFKTQRDLNRRVRPAPPAPRQDKPKEAPEASE